MKYLTEMLDRRSAAGPIFTAGLLWLTVFYVLLFDRLPQKDSEIQGGTLVDALYRLADLGPVVVAVLIAGAAWFLGELYGVVFRVVARWGRPHLLEPALSKLGGEAQSAGSELAIVGRVAAAGEHVRDFYQLLLDRWRSASEERGLRRDRLQRQAWISPPAAALSWAAAQKFEVVTWWMAIAFVVALAAIFISVLWDLIESRRKMQSRFIEAATRDHTENDKSAPTITKRNYRVPPSLNLKEVGTANGSTRHVSAHRRNPIEEGVESLY